MSQYFLTRGVGSPDYLLSRGMGEFSIAESAIIDVSASGVVAFYSTPRFEVYSGGIPSYTNRGNNMPGKWMRKSGGNSSDYDVERKLFRQIYAEAINKTGVCAVYYSTSFDTQYDRIFGEDNDRRFIRKFDVMTRYQLQPEDKMWTKFTIEGIDNFSMFMSKEHFRRASTYSDQLVVGNKGKNTCQSIVPKNGDILQVKFNKYLYEVVTVKEEAMMWHQDKHHTWELIVKPYIDRGMKLSNDTSASMGSISADVGIGGKDIFNIKEILLDKIGAIDYHPKICDRNPRDPNGGW